MFKTLIPMLAGLALVATSATAWADRANDQFTVAAEHYRLGRWKLAAEEFQSFLAEFPENDRADSVTFFLGESLVQVGQLDEARLRFQEFLRRAPEHRYARQADFRVAETAYLSGRIDEASRDLLNFIETRPADPLNAFALPYLGEIALSKNDFASAKSHYTHALKEFPSSTMDSDSRFGLARALEALGETEEAARFYGYLVGQENEPLADDAALRLGILHIEANDYGAARSALEEFATRYSGSPWSIHANYWLAKSLLELNEPDLARQSLQDSPPQDHQLAAAWAFLAGQAASKAGDSIAARRSFEAVHRNWPSSHWADDALHFAAKLAFESADWPGVETVSSQFLGAYPENQLRASVLHLQGRAQLKQGRHRDAIHTFQQATRESNSSEFDNYYLGLAHLRESEHELALQALRQVRVQDNQSELSSGLQAALAAALVGLERWEDAIEPLRSYLAQAPKGPDAPESRAQLTVALAQLGRIDEAAEVHEKIDSENAAQTFYLPTTHYLAEAAYRAGKSEQAKRLFTILADQDTSQTFREKGLSGLAWLQFENNQHEDSAATFERLLVEHPDSSLAAEAALMRAKSLEKAGSPSGALAMYRAVLENHAESDYAWTAMLASARIHDQLEQDDAAAELFERAAQWRPSAPDVDSVLYQWAWVLSDLNREDEAAEIFSRISQEFTASRFWADATYRLAERAAQKGDYESVLAISRRITASNDSTQQDVVCHAAYLYGQAAAALLKWDDVGASMSRVLDLCGEGPLRQPAEYWVAESFYRRGEYDEAGRRFELLQRTTQGRADAWLAMAPLRQAQVLAHQKKWAESHALASTIAERHPNFRQQYEVDYLLGRCLVSQAKFTDARQQYETVIRSPQAAKTETAAMAQWMIGETYFHQKQYDDAIKSYHRVVHLFAFPRWQAAALLQAGKCHEMKAEWKQAVELYAQMLRDYGQTNFSDEASRRLRVARERIQIAAAP